MRKNHAWFLSRSNTCAISLTCTCTEITMELGGLSEFPFYTAAIFLRGGQFITVEGARWRGEHGCFCWARRALKFLICWQSWGQSFVPLHSPTRFRRVLRNVNRVSSDRSDYPGLVPNENCFRNLNPAPLSNGAQQKSLLSSQRRIAKAF